ncbi:MAG: polyprenyl synthetase family protein [candidate division WOR-3 bacterium]|nr:polyprenyl synthetase family protein [candidate division WOR-3 bacterium]
MNIEDYLAEKKKLVDEALRKYFSDNNPFFEVMYYSIDRGKRIRPILAIASYEANGGTKLDEILSVACGLELIHTYSLIHDDLPAMDNDDYRRGKESAHKKFGEALAVLSGDGLFAYAFELFTESETNLKQRFRVIKEVSEAVGPKGVVYGQVLDIQKHEEANPKTLRQIHLNKTAKFISLSIKVGAIMASAPDEIIKVLEKGGIYLGILFQYTDDILDVTGKKEKLGKTPRKDIFQEKLTAPRVYGLSGAKFRAQRYAALAKNTFHRLGPNFELFNEITDYVLNRTF